MISFGLTLVRMIQAIVRSWGNPVFRSTLALAFLILLSGTLFYHSVEGWSWVDAAYFSVMTALTIGFGDLAPTTAVSRIFTIIYALVSVGVFVALVTQMARALLEPPTKSKEKSRV